MQRKEDQVKNAISAFIYIINLFIIQVCQSGSVGLGGPGCQCGPGGQGCPDSQGGPGGHGGAENPGNILLRQNSQNLFFGLMLPECIQYQSGVSRKCKATLR